MQKQPKTSLLLHLALIIAITVVSVFALNGILQYSLAREAITKEMNLETDDALQRLSVNFAPFVSAYAVNEYQRLLSAEIENRLYLAILVDDKMMAEMTSQASFTSGRIRNALGHIEDFDADNPAHQRLLNKAFIVKSQTLFSNFGEPIGTLTIFNTDRAITEKLESALYSTMLLSILSSVLLILLLLGISKRVLILPLKQITNQISEQDADGIPLRQLPDFVYKETSLLSQTINHMLGVIGDSRAGLEREKLLLENVLQATRVGVWEWNVETGETRFNERWADIIGYRLKDLEPISISTWVKYVHPDDLKVSEQALERHFTGQAPYYEVEVRMQHKAGHWVWVLDRGKVISWTREGKPLWMTGTHQDITRRKQASQELSDSLARYQQLSESSPAGVWQINAEGQFVYVSPRWIEISGYERNQIGTQWTDVVHPDDLALVRDAWNWVRQHRQMLQTEFRFAKPDGRVVWVLCLANPQVDADDKVIGWIGTITDITRLKNTAEQLKRASEQAEAANIAKSRFLATMSHEIRTPMNGILGMAQLLLDQKLPQRQRDDYTRTILHSGQSLLALLNDILDLSKVEAGKMELEEGIVNPAQVLNECQRLFIEPAYTKGLQLYIHQCISSNLNFTGDPYRLNQMLSNLINNAIKFTEQGHIALECTEISRDETTAVLEFSVTDTGIGISRDKQNQIFNPFTQADSSTTRVFGGTGLGLSIVAKLAEMMHGSVGVVSKQNEGSRFWFTVALKLRKTGSAPAKIADPLAHENTLTGHVLIAEDVSVNHEIVSAMLEHFGLESTCATNGREALELYTKAPDRYQLILMDLHMPDLDGNEATRAIRAWESEQGYPPIPIVAMTADVFPEDKAACFAAGMNDYIAKPIMADNLYQTLSKWIKDRASEEVPTPSVVVFQSSVSELLVLIDTVLGQLEKGAFNAIDTFELLEQRLTGYSDIQMFNEISLLIDAFRFEEAIPKLWEFREKLMMEMGGE